VTLFGAADGSARVTVNGVTVALGLTAAGEPEVTYTQGGKPVAKLPKDLKKNLKVAELLERKKAVARTVGDTKRSLEQAMCAAGSFTGAELKPLMGHPLVRPLLERLVLRTSAGMGYPVKGGTALRRHDGTTTPVKAADGWSVAHPLDLLAAKDWPAWQAESLKAERVQPFKQVFRELYPITDTERGTNHSRRYAGHQVNPRQALALLGGRGWVARPEEGVSRTFHAEGLTARLGFEEAFYTPADIEGLTLEVVVFTRKGEDKALALDDIPPRVFSETMRDLDLVVSVAHRGGVDPEATASTVEMRAALVREACALLGIDNVAVQANHAIIRGALGQYSVHLGSAGVLLLPGTAIPIVAVHSQHRGRLFLPFADEDPRSAEVLSKVLLLARDREIKDPNILEWIRAGSGH
jgi:hypothetical protein